MRTAKLWLVLLLVTVVPTLLSAQTATFKLAWTQAEAPVIAAAFQYTLKVDTAAPVLMTAACVASGTGSTCSASLPALVSGSHTLILTAVNGFGSTASDPLTGGPPSKPTLLTVTVTITIP